MSVAPAAAIKKVVIVNGSHEILDLLEAVLDPGHYDIVFVESSNHAYSRIKLVQPDLVILCMRIEDVDGFQILSMLKMDRETSTIPVLTYTTEYEGQNVDGGPAERPDDEELLTININHALRMN